MGPELVSALERHFMALYWSSLKADMGRMEMITTSRCVQQCDQASNTTPECGKLYSIPRGVYHSSLNGGLQEFSALVNNTDHQLIMQQGNMSAGDEPLHVFLKGRGADTANYRSPVSSPLLGAMLGRADRRK